MACARSNGDPRSAPRHAAGARHETLVVASAIIAAAIAASIGRLHRAQLILSVSAGSENHLDSAQSTEYLRMRAARAPRPRERGA
jgi:hypothetical protein